MSCVQFGAGDGDLDAYHVGNGASAQLFRPTLQVHCGKRKCFTWTEENNLKPEPIQRNNLFIVGAFMEIGQTSPRVNVFDA